MISDTTTGLIVFAAFLAAPWAVAYWLLIGRKR